MMADDDAPNLNRALLIDMLMKRMGWNRTEADQALQDVLGIMTRAILAGDKVKVPGFGVLIVSSKRARMGRNPATGESMMLPARRVLTFKPSAVLRARVNGR
jgi:integration host factor subunit alpha